MHFQIILLHFWHRVPSKVLSNPCWCPKVLANSLNAKESCAFLNRIYFLVEFGSRLGTNFLLAVWCTDSFHFANCLLCENFACAFSIFFFLEIFGSIFCNLQYHLPPCQKTSKSRTCISCSSKFQMFHFLSSFCKSRLILSIFSGILVPSPKIQCPFDHTHQMFSMQSFKNSH